MSKLFWFSEFLGESKGNKWSQILKKVLLIKGVKSPRKKSLFFGDFCLTSSFFWYCCYYPHRSRDALSPLSIFFKASALWANAFYKLKLPSVCLFVCLSVCPSVCSLLRYHLNVILLPLPKNGCLIFLEVWYPWGKVMERNGLRFENLVWKWSKIAKQNKKVFFLADLPTKQGGNHASRWIRDLWFWHISRLFDFLHFGWFFPFFKNIKF